MFWTNPPVGGAVTGPSDKKRSEVFLRHLGRVCAKFHCNRTNGAGDLLSCRHKRNMPVIAPPWGCFEHSEVALFPWPSRDVCATFHGNSTSCAWVEAFRLKRSTLQTLGANRSQSGRSIHNLTETLLFTGHRGTVYWFAWFLDQKWRSTVHKCVLDTSCWWCYNRPMWIVHLWHPVNVHAEFRCRRANAACAFLCTNLARTDARMHAQTRTQSENILSWRWQQLSW